MGRREGLFFFAASLQYGVLGRGGCGFAAILLWGVGWAEQGVVSPRDSSVGVFWAQEDVGAMSCLVQTHK